MTAKTSLRVLALCLALLAAPAWSATYWVGSSAACTGSNVHASLASALLSAAFNGTQSDEIRLTNTIAYTGADGDVTLTDWSPSTTGSLTIAGGYSDCFTSASGRTVFGNTSGVAITVETSSQSASNVTLRRLDVRSADTGLSATGGASVILDNVRIGDHSLRGIYVTGGAYVDVQSDSIVELNGDISTTSWGGGVFCSGTDSEVTLRGRIYANSAEFGGNAYLSSGCFMMLMGGSTIDANQVFGPGAAQYGGGVYVNNGGELYASGGTQRVSISNNYAGNGAGIYVTGTGRATLVNTLFQGNEGFVGAAIYAVGGGTSSPQVVMDRASSCPFQISCSEMEGNRTESSIVYVDDSYVRINRTIIELSNIWTVPDTKSLIHGTNGALLRLGHVGMYRNTTDHAIWNQDSQFEILHATIARNEEYVSGGANLPATALLSQDSTGSAGANYLHNSIIADSTGVDLQGGSMQSECILADSDPGDLPGGTYYIATPQFINAGSGDFRQTSASPGVDMCNANPLLAWASTEDIEKESLPVNDANNDQGNPGEAGGYHDAGFDENHMNVGDDYFTLTAARTGSGTGSIISIPLGISCGSDCQEDFFNETLVELHANAGSGSTFDGWIGCPLPSGNICYTSVTEDTTVTAEFGTGSTEASIFSDRFETAP